ncbi:MAG: hypothetical protein MK078_02710 [Crocinitomicaceae bacterium]|nr:hypothetical protein [Crocinitomicaceae bacterium]
MSFPCPEIEELSALWVKHKVMVRVDRNTLLSNKAYYPLVEFQISGENFSLFVDDEFSDFRKNYPLLNFCLVLRELDGYKYTSEYEVWCQERFFDSSDETIKEAFKNLKYVTNEVEKILGKIDPIISDWDFEMNTGAAQALRRSK